MTFDQRWQRVACASCGRRYRCTPTDDYFNATNDHDGMCEACLLRPHGLEGKVIEIHGDEVMALARAAAEVKTEFDRRFTGLRTEQAAYVRQLRVDEGASWRGVAWACANEWGGDWESNQLAGMALCERAAAMHGEDPNAEPWN